MELQPELQPEAPSFRCRSAPPKIRPSFGAGFVLCGPALPTSAIRVLDSARFVHSAEALALRTLPEGAAGVWSSPVTWLVQPRGHWAGLASMGRTHTCVMVPKTCPKPVRNPYTPPSCGTLCLLAAVERLGTLPGCLPCMPDRPKPTLPCGTTPRFAWSHLSLSALSQVSAHKPQPAVARRSMGRRSPQTDDKYTAAAQLVRPPPQPRSPPRRPPDAWLWWRNQILNSGCTIVARSNGGGGRF